MWNLSSEIYLNGHFLGTLGELIDDHIATIDGEMLEIRTVTTENDESIYEVRRTSMARPSTEFGFLDRAGFEKAVREVIEKDRAERTDKLYTNYMYGKDDPRRYGITYLPPDAKVIEVPPVQEPTEPGWYAYSGGAQTMIFHLREVPRTDKTEEWYRQWSVHFGNGTSSDCKWGYIEQALGVWRLEKIR